MPTRPPRSGTLREVAFGSSILLGILGFGTIGYVLVEGWSVLDAFYMTFITLTTIGFAEVEPLSPVGKLFTVAISAVGIGTFAYIASRTVQSLVTSQAFSQRRMQRKIDHLSGHYVIAGYGRLGQRIARDLVAAGRDVVVIDRREDRAEQLTTDGFLYVQHDAEEEATLRSAGLERAAGLVLVLPQDAANVFVALTAREIRPDGDLFIVARTNEQSSLNKLLRAGADKVISPLEIGADRIAQTILRPRVDRFMEQVLGVDALDFDMEEVEVQGGSLLAGRSLAEVEFKRRFNAIVVGVQQANSGQWRFNPDATIPIDAGDALIVLGPADMIRRIRQEGCSPSTSIASVR